MYSTNKIKMSDRVQLQTIVQSTITTT